MHLLHQKLRYNLFLFPLLIFLNGILTFFVSFPRNAIFENKNKEAMVMSNLQIKQVEVIMESLLQMTLSRLHSWLSSNLCEYNMKLLSNETIYSVSKN